MLLFYPFKASRKQRDLVMRNVKDSSLRSTQPDISVLGLYLALTRLNRSNKRYMSGHNRKLSLGSAHADHYSLTVKSISLRSRYRQSKAFHRATLFAFSTASSIVPTKRNADSGRSSCLPSIISLKPLIVSERGTYFPAIPVNFSETSNG